jgi:ATP-dependent RNA helicase DDX43
MKRLLIGLTLSVLTSVSVNADGYQHGWKVYDKPQAGATYGSRELNPYGAGGSKSYSAGGGRSYGAGGGKSYGAGGGRSYGAGGGNSYGQGGGKNPSNPWHVSN